MAGSEGHRAGLDRGPGAFAFRLDDFETAMTLKNTEVAVIGMARSGIAAVELLLEKEAVVTAVDVNPATPARLAELGIAVQPQTEASVANAELVVLSPGVPADLDLAQAARARGARVI